MSTRWRDLVRRAVDFYRTHGHRTEEGYSIGVFAAVHRMSGRHRESVHCGEEALEIAQEVNHLGHIANAHNALGATLAAATNQTLLAAEARAALARL
ncbi:hypothetical protein [Actinocrispum wychmicini]|uniref:Tetratricopeptide repeat protein n=1 Tax=Actinocrispum wychmicini TaxID=1213861 RepID=A0A4R2J7R2_9PSEU|nr:hypothetical protein [Actinocrispum wychmicini]TCO54207.1 hypothetical protein EV192_109187 [Actinocrispum wychmicini]